MIISIGVWLSARANHVVLSCTLTQEGYMEQNVADFPALILHFDFFFYKLQNTVVCLNKWNKILSGLSVYIYFDMCQF